MCARICSSEVEYDMLEKFNENKLIRAVEGGDGEAIKLFPHGKAGMPDRLILMPMGKVFFIEVKKDGAQPTELQKYWHKRLQELGFECWVMDEHNLDSTIRKVIGEHD